MHRILANSIDIFDFHLFGYQELSFWYAKWLRTLAIIHGLGLWHRAEWVACGPLVARNLGSGCGKYRYAVEDCMVLSLPFRKKSIVHLLKYIKILNLYSIQPILLNRLFVHCKYLKIPLIVCRVWFNSSVRTWVFAKCCLYIVRFRKDFPHASYLQDKPPVSRKFVQLRFFIDIYSWRLSSSMKVKIRRCLPPKCETSEVWVTTEPHRWHFPCSR